MSGPLIIPWGAGVTIPEDRMRFEFSRSGGPGGQHVNTTDTRVRLRFDLAGCVELTEAQRGRIYAARPGDITADGELLITVETHRSRGMNIDEARERLINLILRCMPAPKPRYATRPTRSSKEDRLQSKTRRSAVKAGRGRVKDD